jgi:hypothetical protein
MSPSALTSENSTIVMIDHAVGFGNVFRSHDLSLHVNKHRRPGEDRGRLRYPSRADQRRGLRPLRAAVQRTPGRGRRRARDRQPMTS